MHPEEFKFCPNCGRERQPPPTTPGYTAMSSAMREATLERLLNDKSEDLRKALDQIGILGELARVRTRERDEAIAMHESDTRSWGQYTKQHADDQREISDLKSDLREAQARIEGLRGNLREWEALASGMDPPRLGEHPSGPVQRTLDKLRAEVDRLRDEVRKLLVENERLSQKVTATTPTDAIPANSIPDSNMVATREALIHVICQLTGATPWEIEVVETMGPDGLITNVRRRKG